MAAQQLITPALLRKLLRYEPDTGKLFWIVRPVEMFKAKRDADRWNTRYAGKEAFTAYSNGYLLGRLAGATLKAHRVIWAIYYGEWPSQHIDHINGIPGDNRIENMRVVTDLENARNMPMRKDNASGVTGVSWNNHTGKWTAYISTDGKVKNLGLFSSFDDAVVARKSAEIGCGYHANHGRAVGAQDYAQKRPESAQVARYPIRARETQDGAVATSERAA